MEAGFRLVSPAERAFLFFADVAERLNDSAALCARTLSDAGVAVAPGLTSTVPRDSRFVRFRYCRQEADIIEVAMR